MSEIKRCPFCSIELMPNANQDDLYVKRYGTHWNHPDGPCFLADTEVSPSQVDAWNRRVATQGADGRPVAWMDTAKELHKRCSMWPETSGDGFMALLELRNHVEALIKADAAPSKAISDVLAERERQGVQWGGAGHDDEHAALEWIGFIDHQTDKAVRETAGWMLESSIAPDVRVRLVKIAALAVAAIESIDRLAAIAPREET